jgi:hypothetical protein
MRTMRIFRRGRVLQATFGCNPNSSSLGVDVTFLLFGATFASALAVVLGALLRRPAAATSPLQRPAAPPEQQQGPR